MNTYSHSFRIKCPSNGKTIGYRLQIQSLEKVMVEEIVQAVLALPATGFHEDVADLLAEKLPGLQIVRAHHHGVDIETQRGYL